MRKRARLLAGQSCYVQITCCKGRPPGPTTGPTQWMPGRRSLWREQKGECRPFHLWCKPTPSYPKPSRPWAQTQLLRSRLGICTRRRGQGFLHICGASRHGTLGALHQRATEGPRAGRGRLQHAAGLRQETANLNRSGLHHCFWAWAQGGGVLAAVQARSETQDPKDELRPVNVATQRTNKRTNK